jgi:hypothetical protein
MEMVLVDWTRMGKAYCIAGAVREGNGYRTVRPLFDRHRRTNCRIAGWSAYQLDGHCRWEIVELMAPSAALAEPPHAEDLWVRRLQSQHRLAEPSERREILSATTVARDEPLFGEHLHASASAVFLRPGAGCRSLATLCVPSMRIRFRAFSRAGAEEPDFRVTLDLEGLNKGFLPVKDHQLLSQAEAATTDLRQQVEFLAAAIKKMGAHVAVRLGLSRPFAARADCAPSYCWLMADGFFSLENPQP